MPAAALSNKKPAGSSNQSAGGLFCALENLGIAWRYTRVASLGLMVMLWKRFSIYSLSKYVP